MSGRDNGGPVWLNCRKRYRARLRNARRRVIRRESSRPQFEWNVRKRIENASDTLTFTAGRNANVSDSRAEYDRCNSRISSSG